MYLPTAGGVALTYSGERQGSGVTATSPSCQCFAAPCDCAPFDQAPDISTLPIFGSDPGQGTPIFRTETDQLDWFRLVALAVGVLIGWKLLK